MDMQELQGPCMNYASLGGYDTTIACMPPTVGYQLPPMDSYAQPYEYAPFRSCSRSTGSVSEDSVNTEYVDDHIFQDAMRVIHDDPTYMIDFDVDKIDDQLNEEPIPTHIENVDYKVEPDTLPTAHCAYTAFNERMGLSLNPLNLHALGTSPASPTDSNTNTSTTTESLCTATSSSQSKSSTRRTKVKKGTSKYTLPDFMCQIIMDKQFNPKVIKWLNEEERVFLIVKPKIIAQLWGERKGNPKMNYPSMSRGIRERRKYGYFDRVPQDPRYPKKLTYKFGPMVAQYLKR